MNELSFVLFSKDVSSGAMVEDGLEFTDVVVETQLHGGFGRFSGKLRLEDYDAYRWYEGYHNNRLKVWDSWREVAWEGRVEDVTALPGYGVEVMGFGYWRNFFDVPMKDEDTWASGTHYAEDIIEVVIERCCRQIARNYVNFEDTDRDVAPFKIVNNRYPHDIVTELLAGGDKWGEPVYFAVWENRWPYLFVRDSDVDWYVRVEDCSPAPKLKRSMETMGNAIIVEYSVEGVAGDVNDSGTATGERAQNFITLTDTGQGWDEGQWDSGFDVAITSGPGSGQVRDILRTRLEPTVVDSGWCVPFRVGTTTPSAGEAHNIIDANGAAVINGHFTWDVSGGEGPLWVDVIGGSCAGQQREINEGADFANAAFNVPITPDWTADDGEYPSSNGSVSGKYIVYKPATLVTQGKSWVHQTYNTGYVVEIVQGRGAGQRRRVTETKPITTDDGAWDMLKVEPDWDTQPDDTSYFEIHEVAEVVSAGKATGGSHNTLVDDDKERNGVAYDWTVDGYNDDYEVVVMNGACSGQVGRIVDTTADTLTVEPLWDDDIPDSTSEYEIRVIREEEDEEAEEGACTQIVVTSEWTTRPNDLSEYEIRQKEDGGLLSRTTTHVSGRAIRDIKLARKKVYSIGTTTPGDAERVAGRLRALLRDPQQRSQPFTIKRVFNTRWVEYPLVAVRAGDVIEVTDLFGGQIDSEDLDSLKRFHIIRTSFRQSDPALTITPDNVDAEIATLIASVRK